MTRTQAERQAIERSKQDKSRVYVAELVEGSTWTVKGYPRKVDSDYDFKRKLGLAGKE